MAVRCFHRHIPAVEQKYAAISQAFRRLNSPYFVGFEFLAQGIRVRQQLYPVLKMDWAEGDVLGLWLERNHGMLWRWPTLARRLRRWRNTSKSRGSRTAISRTAMSSSPRKGSG
jgi:hypothetical protein